MHKIRLLQLLLSIRDIELVRKICTTLSKQVYISKPIPITTSRTQLKLTLTEWIMAIERKDLVINCFIQIRPLLLEALAKETAKKDFDNIKKAKDIIVGFRKVNIFVLPFFNRSKLKIVSVLLKVNDLEVLQRVTAKTTDLPEEKKQPSDSAKSILQLGLVKYVLNMSKRRLLLNFIMLLIGEIQSLIFDNFGAKKAQDLVGKSKDLTEALKTAKNAKALLNFSALGIIAVVIIVAVSTAILIDIAPVAEESLTQIEEVITDPASPINKQRDLDTARLDSRTVLESTEQTHATQDSTIVLDSNTSHISEKGFERKEGVGKEFGEGKRSVVARFMIGFDKKYTNKKIQNVYFDLFRVKVYDEYKSWHRMVRSNMFEQSGMFERPINKISSWTMNLDFGDGVSTLTEMGKKPHYCTYIALELDSAAGYTDETVFDGLEVMISEHRDYNRAKWVPAKNLRFSPQNSYTPESYHSIKSGLQVVLNQGEGQNKFYVKARYTSQPKRESSTVISCFYDTAAPTNGSINVMQSGFSGNKWYAHIDLLCTDAAEVLICFDPEFKLCYPNQIKEQQSISPNLEYVLNQRYWYPHDVGWRAYSSKETTNSGATRLQQVIIAQAEDDKPLTKTVYAKFRDRAGNETPVVSKSISLRK